MPKTYSNIEITKDLKKILQTYCIFNDISMREFVNAVLTEHPEIKELAKRIETMKELKF